MNANSLYEAINYGWAFVSACMITFLLIYLFDTLKATGWRTFLLDRPLAEQLAIAILIADGGNMIDRLARGAWRSVGGDLSTVANVVLIGVLLGSTVGMLGVLCKLRIVSIARYGHWPWATAASLLLWFFVAWAYTKGT